MSTEDGFTPIEYPDSAGYPDGTGFLDEGTTALADEVTADAVRAVDRPSADAESEIEVHRRDDEHVYAATIDGLEVARLRYDEVDDRVVVITTTVVPEFRGRGIATDLIADALDDIRERGRRVTVLCRVVAAFIAGNPQYTDLIDSEHPGRM
jgi:predicted GNAT family acetyltransferase